MLRIDITSQVHGNVWLQFTDQQSVDAYIADVTASQHWGADGEWSYTVTDVTAQVAQQQAVQDGLARQSVGASIIANIFAINEAKMSAGTLTVTQLQAMMQDPTISIIRELLWSGALSSAKAMVQAYDVTAANAYFTASDQAAILALLANY